MHGFATPFVLSSTICLYSLSGSIITIINIITVYSIGHTLHSFKDCAISMISKMIILFFLLLFLLLYVHFSLIPDRIKCKRKQFFYSVNFRSCYSALRLSEIMSLSITLSLPISQKLFLQVFAFNFQVDIQSIPL